LQEKVYAQEENQHTLYASYSVLFLPSFLSSFPFLSYLVHVSLLAVAFVILVILCLGDSCSLLMAICHYMVAV